MAQSVGDALARRHPLQRISSPSQGLSFVLHAFGISCFAASFKYLLDAPSPVAHAVGWHFQYLTIIGLAMATVTFIIGSIADLTLSRRLFAVKNALSVCTAPLEVLVALLYWSIKAVDSTLVIPKGYELPVIPDFGFHAMPALLLTLDLLFFSPPWTIRALPATAISGAIAVGYWVWLEYCHSYNGWYPYPMLDLLSPAGRGGVFVGSALVMTLSTITLQRLYGVINGYGVREAVRARPGQVKG